MDYKYELIYAIAFIETYPTLEVFMEMTDRRLKELRVPYNIPDKENEWKLKYNLVQAAKEINSPGEHTTPFVKVGEVEVGVEPWLPEGGEYKKVKVQGNGELEPAKEAVEKLFQEVREDIVKYRAVDVFSEENRGMKMINFEIEYLIKSLIYVMLKKDM